MTDETNIGDAYAIIPLMWSFGVTIACVMLSIFCDRHSLIRFS